MDQLVTEEQPQQQDPQGQVDQGQQKPDDVFAIDETTLASLTPEARVAFDSTVKNLRERVDGHYKSQFEKQLNEERQKYQDYDEQKKYAEALRQLANDPQFVQWYQLRSQQQQQQSPAPQVASAEEWAQAVLEASNNQPQRMQAIIARQFQMMAAPTIQKFNEQQVQMQQDKEIDSLFRRHPDAEELDDPSIWGEGKTPLELAIHQVVDKEGKSFEEAYNVARAMVDAADKRAKNAALGLVNGKKQSVTEQVSQTSKQTENIIEVASAEEALRKNVEATMKGLKVTYVAKPKVLRR